MKFLLESENNEIEIYKYREGDLVLGPSWVALEGKDRTAKTLRIPSLKGPRHFVSGKQVAQYPVYIYIPRDQVEGIEDDDVFVFPKPVAIKTISKMDWKRIKESHPYRGK